jgi:LacI family transcriptional regulator
MRSAQVTIKDIAKQLGISPSTVSRALKDHPDISPMTKKQVNELAKALRYKPNAIALSLRRSKTYIIGLIIPQIVHHFFSSVISGIEEIANEVGYNVMIFQSNESYEREVKGTQAFLSSRVDGVLVSLSKTTFAYDHFTNLLDDGIPVVFFDRACKSLNLDTVIADDYEGAFLATEYLIQTGCQRIAHLGAPQHLLIGKYRLQGFLDALKKYDLPINEKLILKCDTHEEALVQIPPLLSSSQPPDGIFAVNDATAVGAILIAKRFGLKIPDDISVIGFGDGPLATISDPTLTTIVQPGYEMGRLAAQLLLDRLLKDQTNGPIKKILKTKLVARQSTKPIKEPIILM